MHKQAEMNKYIKQLKECAERDAEERDLGRSRDNPNVCSSVGRLFLSYLRLSQHKGYDVSTRISILPRSSLLYCHSSA